MDKLTRRVFLSNSMKGIVGASLGLSGLTVRSIQGANDKVVLGLIGCGGRGTSVLLNMVKVNENVEVKYVCDVNDRRGDDIRKSLTEVQGYSPKRTSDMRDIFDDPDVHAVQISTPPHWHALATVWACQAGKDVYVEKTPSKTIWEGRKIIEAAHKYNRIVQIGTQNRSAPYAYSAKEYIENGGLGRVVHVKCYTMLGGGPWSPQPNTEVPEGLDWDKWLGPAPYHPYNPGRHNMGPGRGWMNHWDYSNGPLGDDGSHVLDLARLVIGDPGHPISAQTIGGRLAFDDERQTPDIQVVNYDYGDFTLTIDVSNFPPYMKKSQGDVRYGDKFPYWPQNATRIEIYGTERMMYVGRHGGGWQVFEEDGKVVDQEYGYFPDDVHQNNFIESVRNRKEPNGDVVNGHLSATLVHLGNVSLRIGKRQLFLDPDTEKFINDTEADQYLKPKYRKNFRIPAEV